MEGLYTFSINVLIKVVTTKRQIENLSRIKNPIIVERD